jgi:Zn-dependent M16 (insulinase) family peptidase
MNVARPSFYLALLLGVSLFSGSLPMALAQSGNVSFENLEMGKMVNGFRTAKLFLDDADKPMGARFVHARTGFTLDLLQIQSVPQAFMWVNSFPTSDMGEPHTQEHLLLGKGNVGRAVASLQDMSLSSSSAFTMQWRTAYHFHTAAGADVFFNLFERQVDALLHPDYTDEEIRREVRNFGVTENPADKSLHLEEKGTVYNEMVSSTDRPISRLFRALNHALYGRNHPLAYNSGGEPAAIREMKAEDIKRFHRENYHLGNMGMVASFSKELALTSILKRTDEILNRLEKDAGKEKRQVKTEADLPNPQMAASGTIQIVEYPHKNDQQPGLMVFAWPARLKLEPKEELLLSLFLSNIAGDPTTNLYKRFVDTKTREMDLGARGVWGSVDSDQGNPVLIGLNDVTTANMTEEKVREVRQKVLEEFTRIASWKDGSPELAEFNARLKNRVIQTRRDLSKFVNSPPAFGFRGTSSAWMTHLYQLGKTSEFKKSLTMKSELEFVEKLLSGNQNFWKGYIAGWKLADTTPYAFAAKASPQLVVQEEKERAERARAELNRLKAQYKVTDEQDAIRRYRDDYDRTTVELEKLTKTDAQPFLEKPPLTLDDQLDYREHQLAGGIKMVASTFDNMTSATTGLALSLKGVSEDELFYLSALPALLRNVGVIENGKPVSYEEMSERLRKEVLSLNASFSTNLRTDRVELIVRGSGNDTAESERALHWMKLILESPDWRTENLPRIRDVVDQALGALRNTMQGSEENWVNDPANAYRRQDNPLVLSVSSFLTRTHNVHRLRWLLKDAGSEQEREAISKYLERLAGAPGNREELKTMLGVMKGDQALASKLSAKLKPLVDEYDALPVGAKQLATEAAKDLDQILADIPDDSLQKDWAYLCRQIRVDLLTPPAKVLMDLNNLRQRLLKTSNARMFMIASTSTQKTLEKNVNNLLSTLKTEPATTAARLTSAPLIKTRLNERVAEAKEPVFVGLVNPNTQGGVFLNSAPLITYDNTDRESLLRYLASKLYGGGGAHGIFMKTWGAGLAYSNGLGGSPGTGRLNYYAERTPELPQTLRFVIEELKKAQPDPSLVEYAVAQTFLGVRSADAYEGRGEAMAADLADGVTPELVSRFRRAILELRRSPKLAEELHQRMNDVYASVLPGYGTKAKTIAGGIYYVIGPDKQLKAYEDYLKSVEGTDTRLFRLYPRDYWMTLKETEKK